MTNTEPPRRRASLIAAGLAVAALAAGCGGTSTPKPVAAVSTSPAVAASPTSSPTPASSPTAAAPPPGTARLNGKQLLAEVLPYPGGVKKYPVAGSTGGVFTVNQYAESKFDDAAAGRDYLNSLNFVVAARRIWSTGGASRFVEITIIELDATGATQFKLDALPEYTDASPKPDQTLPLPDGIDGTAYVFHKTDSSGNRGVSMIAQVGNVVVEINCGSKVGLTTGDVDKAVALMKAQVARLR